MLQISVDDTRLQKLLAAMERRAINLTPVFAGPIDKSITMLFTRQFATNGAYSGQAWAPLRPSTQEWRVRAGGNRGGLSHPLWDTGEGRASFVTVGPNSFRNIGPHSYERGSTLPRMALHQVGYTITQWGGRKFKTPRRVPARPIIPDPVPGPLLGVWEILIVKHLEVHLGIGGNG